MEHARALHHAAAVPPLHGLSMHSSHPCLQGPLPVCAGAAESLCSCTAAAWGNVEGSTQLSALQVTDMVLSAPLASAYIYFEGVPHSGCTKHEALGRRP